MNKKLNNLGYLLNFSSVVMLIALLGILFSNTGIAYEIKSLVLVVFSITQFVITYICKKKMNLENSANWFYSIGFISLLISIFSFSNSDLLNQFFKINGSEYIYLAIIFLFVGSFFLITTLIYDNEKFIKVTYVSLFVVASLLLIFYKIELTLILLIVECICLIANTCFKKNNIYPVSKLFTYIIPFIIFLIIDDISLLSLIELISIEIISLIVILKDNKDFETSLLCLLLIFGTLFINDIQFFNSLDNDICIPIVISLHLLVFLLVDYFDLVKDKFLYYAYKIINYLAIIFVIIVATKESNSAYIVASSLFLIDIISEMILFKNKKISDFFLPVAILLEIACSLLFFHYNFIKIDYSVGLFIVNIVLLILYKFNKRYDLKVIYSILLVLVLSNLVYTTDHTLLSYLVNLGVLIVDYVYLTIFDDKKDSIIDYILYIFLLGLSLVELRFLDINYIKYLILSIFYMGLLYKNMNNRFKSSISLMFLLISTSLYIKGVIANYYVINMLIEILTISVIIALGYINFKNENSRVIFSTILIDISMLDYLVLDKNIYTIIFSLIVSLIMLLYGIKNEEHKCSLISGLILLAISIFNVLMFISNVPFLIYLFIIGFALMLAVMFLINNEKDEEINYCSNCGNKLDKKDTYCSECGEKVK